MKKAALLLVCTVCCGFLFAQESTIRKAQQNFEYAQKSLQIKEYKAATKSLEDAVTDDPQFQLAFIQLGDIYKLDRSYDKAAANYLKAIDISTTIPEARVYYSLATVLLNTGKYDDAIKNLLLFKEKYKGKDKSMLERADKYLKDCDFARIAITQPEKYNPVNLGDAINSKEREYFPALTADGMNLIFSRTVEGNEDFYISHKANKQWMKATPLSDKINTRFNEGAQSISPDGMYLFFTGCNRPDGLGSCDLYVSHKNGKDWETPFNLGETVNSTSWDSQPAISPDGNTLYFVSNRPGGLGGYDIWKTALGTDGNWGKPENLGPDVNTPYNENTPFIHPDGKTLYFSSDGWPGMGNMDIFYSRMQGNGQWGKPINMGYPINTFNEETGLMVSPDGTEGMFSSILKDGFGDMDIYQFAMPEKAKPMVITYVKGIVKDAVTHQFLEATVQVVDLKTKEIKFNDYTSAATGEFLAVMPIGSNYSFNASADGYLFYSDNFELNSKTGDQPYILEINLEKLKPGANVVLKNIFFDTNKFELLPSSLIELNNLLQLLQNNGAINIEIQGHTDNVGSSADNQKLSMQRAQSVYKYLTDNKITAERLSFKGFGSVKPLATNDTAAGRKQNRRTSFIITKI